MEELLKNKTLLFGGGAIVLLIILLVLAKKPSGSGGGGQFVTTGISSADAAAVSQTAIASQAAIQTAQINANLQGYVTQQTANADVTINQSQMTALQAIETLLSNNQLSATENTNATNLAGLQNTNQSQIQEIAQYFTGLQGLQPSAKFSLLSQLGNQAAAGWANIFGSNYSATGYGGVSSSTGGGGGIGGILGSIFGLGGGSSGGGGLGGLGSLFGAL